MALSSKDPRSARRSWNTLLHGISQQQPRDVIEPLRRDGVLNRQTGKVYRMESVAK